MICAILLAIVMLLSVSALGAGEPSSYKKIEDAYNSGMIDRSEMLVQQATAFFAPAALPSQFKTATPSLIKSGTGLVAEIKANWDSFDSEQQGLLAGYMARPELAETFDSPGGFFKIHYDRTGPEAVPDEDLDGDSIPDFIERTAQYLDSTQEVFTSAFGYYQVPTDENAGGDEKYDIYLLALTGYGVTFADSPADSAWDDYTSFIGLHNTFYGFPPNDDPEGDTIGALKVSCAHEFFHATQLAYDRFEEIWWMEASATWMEELIFPEVNDNYNFLTYFFSDPQIGLTYPYGFHMYGTFVWAGFLHQKYDSTILRDIWEACKYNTALEAIDSALEAYGTDIKQVFPEFTVWNYFTGDRAIEGQYYRDAAAYPQVPFDQTFSTLYHDSIQPITGPDGLGCNYLAFDVNPSASGNLEILLDGSDLVRWGMTNIISDDEQDIVEIEISSGIQPISMYTPFIVNNNRVIVIPSVITPFLTTNDYYLSNILLPYGDANYDRGINVGDATYIINHVFKGGPWPLPVVESGDANCDGSTNVADAVKIINYVFKGGEVPCANGPPQ
jgi:hypothetical protein